MSKEDLALNNLQWLICHKSNQPSHIYLIYVYFLNFHPTTCESTCNILPSSATSQGWLHSFGSTAIPGDTKQLLPLDRAFKRIICIYIYIFARSTKSWYYIIRSFSFLVQFVIFNNTFTFDRLCQYALTVTVSWCYEITQEWWFRQHFIHS